MNWLARAILRLYPTAWRERYGSEVDDLISRRRLRALDLVDLLGCAFDARLHPQLLPSSLQLVAGPPAPASMLAVSAPRPAYGAVAALNRGELSRRSFMRRMLGAGLGILSIEFLGGTLAFLWPPPAQGIGVEHRVGTPREILDVSPAWARGRPFEFRPASAFLVNVPAAKAMALGDEIEVTDPGAGEILALWRKCPHLGCMIPMACETRSRFQCYCHQSTYNIVGEKLELGPAPRGMDRFPVRIGDDGAIFVDTREVISGPPKGEQTFRDPHPAGEGCA